MVFKPVGVDEDGKFPTRVEEALSATIETQVAPAVGRVAPLIYDDFSGKTAGALAGQTPLLGPVWRTTGNQPVTIVNGEATSTGTGYAFVKTDEQPEAAWADVRFVTGTNATDMAMTIAFCKADGATMLNDMVHFNWGPTRYSLTVRRDGEEPFPLLLSGNWDAPIPTGVAARVGMVIRGETATLFGPNGEIKSVTDPRVATLNGTTLFWEPRDVNGSIAYMDTVTATGRATEGIATGAASLADLAGAGTFQDSQGRAVGNRETSAQTAVGMNPTNRMPSVEFGATNIRTVILAAASIGATSIQTDGPIPPGTVMTIDSGNAVETVTTSTFSTGVASPYTTPLATALTKAHPARTPATGVVPSTRRGLMYLNASTGYFYLPDTPVMVVPGGKVYLGGSLGSYLSVEADNVIRANVAFQMRSYSTAARPVLGVSASGAMILDTTLGKPIFWSGTQWKDYTGTVV